MANPLTQTTALENDPSWAKHDADYTAENRARHQFDMPIPAMLTAYNNGELGVDTSIQFLQYLVDNGVAWLLPDDIQRTAKALIDVGLISGIAGLI